MTLPHIPSQSDSDLIHRAPLPFKQISSCNPVYIAALQQARSAVCCWSLLTFPHLGVTWARYDHIWACHVVYYLDSAESAGVVGLGGCAMISVVFDLWDVVLIFVLYLGKYV